MRIRSEAHRVCVVARTYPQASFWLLGCGALAAGVGGNTAVLAPLLLVQLAVTTHIAHRMWTTPIYVTLARPGQPSTLIPIQRTPGEPERKHRHARH